MMSPHCTLIINPVSGGYSEQKLRNVQSTLEAGGYTSELLVTKNAADATLFARRICREHEEPFVVAGGGDGTVNGVINGLEHADTRPLGGAHDHWYGIIGGN